MESPQPHQPTLGDFFQAIFSTCEGGSIEFRSLPSEKRFFWPLSRLPRIPSFESDENKYFGCATRDGKGGRKENILQIPVLFTDSDFKLCPREKIDKLLSEFPLPPSVVLFTGGGYHVLWLFKEALGKDEIEAHESMLRRLIGFFQADPAPKDASRVLRVPGTINFKYDQHPKVEIICFDPERRYNLEDFDFYLPPEPARPAPMEAKRGKIAELLRGIDQGGRHTAALSLAGRYVSKGLEPGEVADILRLWNSRNRPPLDEAELLRVATDVFKMHQGKHPGQAGRVSLEDVFDSGRMLETYRAYVQGLEKAVFKTGIMAIDEKLRGVGPGEVLTVLGRAGSFKTAFAQNLLKNFIHSSKSAACFFSLEMPIPSVTERFLQQSSGLTGAEVEAAFREKVPHLGRIELRFKEEMAGLFVVPSKIWVEQIPEYLSLIQEKFKVQVGLVAIDYLGLLDGKGLNEYEILSRLARDLKSCAKAINLPMVVLAQVSRKGGSGETDPDLTAARGSGVIEESADFLLALFQEEKSESFIEPEYDLICKILKNRKGPRNSMWKLDLNPRTLYLDSEAEPWKPAKKKKGYDL
jgi:hypothetical protein